MSHDDHAPSDGRALSRRRLLGAGLAAVGSASAAALAAPRTAAAAPLDVPPWTRAQGRPAGMPYGVPSSHEAHVGRVRTTVMPTVTSAWSFTPLQHLHGTITPNGLVFERHHAGVPDIDPARHRLVIHGAVDQPLMFTMDDLLRLPAVSRIYFMECSGNSYTEWKEPTGASVQHTHGLLSCCQWTGVKLSVLLREAGVKTAATWLLAEGADGAAMTRSIPMDKAMDDCIVAYAQNGERLRPEQGYPLRLVVPGFEGNTHIKWLRRIEAADAPFHTREETSKYTDLLPDGRARQFTLIMDAKSVIVSPSPGQVLRDRGFHELRGLAWSGRGRVARVDVSMDGGRRWHTAQLDEPVLSRCLTAFRLPWQWRGERAVLMSRAIDETGYVQPTRAQLVATRGLASLYHYNAIQAWQVEPDGEIRNVHV